MNEEQRPPEDNLEPEEEQEETPAPPPTPPPSYRGRRAARAEAPPADPAQFPRGFWARVDYMLHHPDEVLESIRRDENLERIIPILFYSTLAMAALYGAVMGATNLLQGSEMAGEDKLMYIFSTAVKVPILFLLTLLIVIPPIYVMNAFMGARLSFRRMLAVLLAGMTVTSITLASMATVALFFSLTSISYNFIKLLHVLFFAYGGVVGIVYLAQCVRKVGGREGRRTPGELFILWLVLYMFVGTQMAWVLRPFVGWPGEEFQLFRERDGNFYESVWDSFEAAVTDD